MSAQANIPRLKIGTNWIPLFRDLPKYTSQLTNDSNFIKYLSYPSHPDRWIINFGASSTGGIEIVSDSCHPTQSYINIAGTKLTPPGYDPDLSTRTSVRGLMKREVSREATDNHLRYGDKPLAYVEEVSALEDSLSAYATTTYVDSEISTLHDELTSLIDSTSTSLHDELTALVDSTSTTLHDELTANVEALEEEIQEVSANMSKSIVRRWEEERGLTFTGGNGGGVVSMMKVGSSAPEVSLEYNDGLGWKDFIVGETSVVLDENQSMFMRAKTTNSKVATDGSNYSKFVMTGEISASDSIMYLLDENGSDSATMGPYCFSNLFIGCTSLTTAPELPATSVSSYGYYAMFNGCTSLITTPELPATTLETHCYDSMFKDCTSLTSAPELPSTALAYYCYAHMFEGCNSLTTVSDLPATTLAEGCYQNIFEGCTSLTQSPELPSTTLAKYCYDCMFYGCTSLTNPPELPATTLATRCYNAMFYGCSSLTEAPELPATTL